MIGTTLNQRFTLDKELGRGGMGAVYRATDQVLQRPVAIKVLKEQKGDDVGRRIRLEAQILARLLHENVVRIYDFGEANGTYFFVMEEVDGSSYQRRWKLLPLADRLRIIAQVAEALDYAHHQGVIHRDVKPANVLLTATDQPKLSDFGLSMIAEQKDESGMIRGTPHYMSPEQCRGKRLDHRTDLYSLGVMLYESAVGAVPFSGPSLTVIGHHAKTAPPMPRSLAPGVSPALEDLILRLLAKDPDARPASGHAVAEALRAEVVEERARADGSDGYAVGPSSKGPDAPAVTVAGPGSRSVAPPGPTTEAAPAAVAAAIAAIAAPSPAVAGATSPMGTPPTVRALLDPILAEPVVLTPDERFLCGHYLAYLLGGSRRRGILLRRPLDPRNADRARLLLAMTSIMMAEESESEGAFGLAVALLEARPDVRPSLSPVVVVKYLMSRETPAQRKRLRLVRKRLHESSAYARAHMTDAKGLLNPGLIPQKLDDLRLIAPARTEVDDQLVGRWNRVSEVWRNDPDFRQAVLRYATLEAHRHPASAELWPEVVYPLIERARWQRRLRPGAEVVLDAVCAKLLHIPDAGERLDRAIRVAVPKPVVDELDLSLAAFADDTKLEAELLGEAPAEPNANEADRLTAAFSKDGVSLHELASDRRAAGKDLVLLTQPDPIRFLQGDLRALWDEAAVAMRTPGAKKAGHRAVPVGPYRLAVIPSFRGRSAAQVAIQGMPNKQIEMLTPSIRAGGAPSKPIVAVWTYQDNSLAIAYLDFKGSVRHILWHAPAGQQENFDDPADLTRALFGLGMEPPEQLDRALSKGFRPRNPV